MRKDKTLEREAVKRMKSLVNDYDLVKSGNHPRYGFVTDFYKANNLKRQNFIKYYNRYKQTEDEESLLPAKRGPRYKTRRPEKDIETRVVELRNLGSNKYEVHSILKPELKDLTPSPSGVYNIFKRYGVNKLTKPMKQEHKKIIKKKAGELGHIDCHYLERGTVEGDSNRYYLVGIIDDYTRIIHVEVVENIQSLTVMFSALRMLNIFNVHYGIKFEAIMSDNGPEFGGKKEMNNKISNPFERLLQEMEIKHIYTRPYRPQTNGKIERFWKTLKEDLLEEVVFDSLDHFKEELLQYLHYYNNMRPHQGINGNIPIEFHKIPSTN